MGDGAGRGYRDARKAEEKAAARYAGMAPEQMHALFDWHRLCARIAGASARHFGQLADHHERRADELFDAAIARGREQP